MSVSVGIGLAFVAMLCWGFGDFLIQRSTRKVGDWETLFFITAFGAVVLVPFVYRDIPALFVGDKETILVLVTASVLLLIAALVSFEALRKGKLAVVEPIWSSEVPVAAILSLVILGERLSFTQTMLIVCLIVGLYLVSFKSRYLSARFLIEKGAILALIGALFMGGANFFIGWGARITDPLMINFVTDLFIAIVSGGYLLARGRGRSSYRDMLKNRGMLTVMSIFDKAAWIAFAFAMTLAPIGVAVALSESYIIVAVMLGLLVNNEKLGKHQKFGLVLALLAAIVLAAITA